MSSRDYLLRDTECKEICMRKAIKMTVPAILLSEERYDSLIEKIQDLEKSVDIKNAGMLDWQGRARKEAIYVEKKEAERDAALAQLQEAKEDNDRITIERFNAYNISVDLQKQLREAKGILMKCSPYKDVEGYECQSYRKVISKQCSFCNTYVDEKHKPNCAYIKITGGE